MPFTESKLLIYTLRFILPAIASWYIGTTLPHLYTRSPIPRIWESYFPCNTYTGTSDGFKFVYTALGRECIPQGHRRIIKEAVAEHLRTRTAEDEDRCGGGTQCLTLDQGDPFGGWIALGPEEGFDEGVWCGPTLEVLDSFPVVTGVVMGGGECRE
ncbi:hypothetical protein BDV12DRAFT_177389 [Aspergillus spectabilis]